MPLRIRLVNNEPGTNPPQRSNTSLQRNMLATKRLTVIGNTNLDVMTYGARGIPAAGSDEVIPEIRIRLGGSAGIAAARASLLALPTQLVSKVGHDASAELLRRLPESEFLTQSCITEGNASSAFTIVFEGSGADRSILSYLGAMHDFTGTHIPEDAYTSDVFLSASYFLLPNFQGEAAAAVLERAQHAQARTALDTGHRDAGWNDTNRTELLRVVLPHVDYFLPNESELLGLTGAGSIEQAAQLINEATGATVITNLGANGAMVHQDGRAHFVSAPR